jgi:hypothetical protein
MSGYSETHVLFYEGVEHRLPFCPHQPSCVIIIVIIVYFELRMGCSRWQGHYKTNTTNQNSVAFSPKSKYTDRAATTWLSQCQLLLVEGCPVDTAADSTTQNKTTQRANVRTKLYEQ